MQNKSTSLNLTEIEAFAIISAVQLAGTVSDSPLIQVDAVVIAKKIQEMLEKNSELVKRLELGWRIREG